MRYIKLGNLPSIVRGKYLGLSGGLERVGVREPLSKSRVGIVCKHFLIRGFFIVIVAVNDDVLRSSGGY